MFICLFLLLTLCSSRPQRPPIQEGEVRNYKNQKRFSYNSNENNNNNLKGSSKKTFEYKYDIEMKDGFHSLDEEEYIENVDCYDDYLEIYSTSKEPLMWNEGDTLSGSEMWNCSGSITRKIDYIDYEGVVDNYQDEKSQKLHKFYVKTQNASFSDFFVNANVNFENFISMEDMIKMEQNKQQKQLNEIERYEVEEDNLKESTLKGGVNCEVLKPQSGDMIDSDSEIPVEINIKGCTNSDCSQMKIDVYLMESHKTSSNKQLKYHNDSFECDQSGSCSYYAMIESPQVKGDFIDNIYMKIIIKNKLGNVILKENKIKLKVNYQFINFINPRSEENVPLDQEYRICWEAPKRVKAPVTVKVYQNDKTKKKGSFVLDEEDLKNGCKNVTFIDSNYQNGKNFYLKATINKHESKSEEFILGKKENKYGFEILNPTSTSLYQSDQIMRIQWNPGNYANKIAIKLKRKRSFINDDKVFEKNDIDSNKKHFEIRIDSNWKTGDYYVQIKYDCALSNKYFCSNIYSQKFSVNKIQKFGDVKTKVNTTEKSITVEYKTVQNVGKHYVTIKQHFPSISPFDFELSGIKKQVYSIKKHQPNIASFYYSSGSIFKSYVEFSYNCFIDKLFCDVEKYDIDDEIPYTRNLGFNYDFKSNGVTKSKIDFFNFTCTNQDSIYHDNINSVIKSPGKIMEKFCNLYPEDVSFNFELSTICENCYIKVPVSMKNFNLEVDFHSVKRLSFEIETGLHYHLKLISTFKGEFDWEFDQAIPNPEYVPSEPISLSIGPVSFSIGPYAGFIFKTEIKADIMFQIISTYSKHHIVVLKFDSTKDHRCSIQLSKTEDEDENEIKAYGTAQLSVIPKLVARIGFEFSFIDITVTKVEANIGLGIQFDVGFSYPPFPANEIYKNDFPHFLRVGAKLFLETHAYYEFFNKLISGGFPSYEDPKELFSIAYYKGFYNWKNKTNLISFGLYSNGKPLTEMEMKVLGYEIGQITKNFVETSFNPFDVFVTKDVVFGNYKVQYLNENITENILKNVIDEIKRKSGFEKDKSIFYSSKRIISLCGPNCKECELNGFDCISCNDGYNLTNNICLEKDYDCEPPMVMINGNCKKCSEPTIYINGKCVSCPDETIYQNGTCIECKAPKVYSNGNCIECDETNGYIYDYSSKKCVKCEAPKILINGSCIYCPNGTVYDDNNKCVECIKPKVIKNGTCKSCENGYGYYEGECIQCKNGHINNEGYCIYCDYNKYWDNLSNECKEYEINDENNRKREEKQTDSSSCNNSDGYYLKNGICMYCIGVVINNECIICSERNQVENKNRTDCVECQSPSGFYSKTSECVNCSDYSMIRGDNGVCIFCEGETFFSDDKCISCPDNSTFDYLTDSCICKKNYIYSHKQNKCLVCSDELEWNETSKSCECKGEKVFNGEKCIECSEIGLRYLNGECICGSEDYMIGERCYLCEKDRFGKSEIDENGIFKCKCDEGKEMYQKSEDMYPKCYDCSEWGGSYNKNFKKCLCQSGYNTIFSESNYFPKCESCQLIQGSDWNATSYKCECLNDTKLLKTDLKYPICSTCDKFNATEIDNTCVCSSGFEKGPSTQEKPFNCLSCESLGGYYDFDDEMCVCNKNEEMRKGKFDDHRKCYKCSDMGAIYNNDKMNCECPEGTEMFYDNEMLNLPRCVPCEIWGGKWNTNLSKCECSYGYEKHQSSTDKYPKCVKCDSFDAIYIPEEQICECKNNKTKDTLGETLICRTCSEINGELNEDMKDCNCPDKTEISYYGQLKCMTCQEKEAVWSEDNLKCVCPEGKAINTFLNKCVICSDYGMETVKENDVEKCVCNGILNKETFKCEQIPNICKDDKVKKGYLLSKNNITFSLYFYEIGKCFESKLNKDHKTKEITIADNLLARCYYNNGTFKGCILDTNYKFITNSKDLPEHTMWMTKGEKDDCSDHKNNITGLIGMFDKCTDVGNGYYMKYKMINNSIELDYYSDKNCSITNNEKQIFKCNECDFITETDNNSAKEYVDKTLNYSVKATCNKFSFNYDPEPIKCLEDKTKSSGYVAVPSTNEKYITLYKFGYCYSSSITTKYTMKNNKVIKCSYQFAEEMCEEVGYKVYTKTKELPAHDFYIIYGSDKQCKDHENGAIKIILSLKDSCYSTLVRDYYKYSHDGKFIYKTNYNDNKCSVEKESKKETKGTCNVCSDGEKIYCKTFSISTETNNTENSDDDLEGWEIALIVVGSVIAFLLVGSSSAVGVVFIVRRKKNQKLGNYNECELE